MICNHLKTGKTKEFIQETIKIYLKYDYKLFAKIRTFSIV